MSLDPIIINLDDIAQWTRCSLGHGGSPLADLVAFSHLQFSQIRGPPALPICAKDSVRHHERSEARRDTRAGHYERKLQTKAGEVKLRIPKLRMQTFETAIIERYRR